MKLEVGMYVRFKKGKITYIRKLLEVIHNYEEFNVYRTVSEYFDYEEKDYFDIVYPGEIIGKPSYNIIDLIEEGDLCIIEFYSPRYEERIKRLFEVEYKKDYTISFQNAHCSMNIFGGVWSNEDKELKPAIKSIVTHEQFESMKYEVE